ncbi:hypothetical protein SAMN02799631_00941 [Methylobacterium sp. 174MFSha1.1]|uniref:glycoside hydrolase family 71/99-like protein n=1 Tax=Methylobacterium sp. 174MFSha1.1 TaxID=1502749 RepID=UPI0008DEF54B|nr:glycoside hydrolase family 71/99-like protein [Methylobacterium sp. 174MFSha1.1]SFU49505.1 hypothetical protein SAMN02799631_00941 [Methylobacterium sp. 174MFSha1.1]
MLTCIIRDKLCYKKLSAYNILSLLKNAIVIFFVFGMSPVLSSERGLLNSHIVGYQGWFQCPSDELGAGWSHWFRANQPDIQSVTVDLLPDMHDYDEDEKCKTKIKLPSGKTLELFSSQNKKTVDRHISWIAKYNIEGIALQRFVVALENESGRKKYNRVMQLMKQSTEKFRKSWYVMYDISSANAKTWADTIYNDWKNLVESGIVGSSSYMMHKGRPVISIWGLGFKSRPGNPEEVLELMRKLRALGVGVTIIGGTPTGWRLLTGDSKEDAAWRDVYNALDVISPWSVGRYRDVVSFNRHLEIVKADINYVYSQGKDYLPVVFPGYSFANTSNNPTLFNLIKRNCGLFYSNQLKGLLSFERIKMIYTAMFDEMDEGTALIPAVSEDYSETMAGKFVQDDTKNCNRDPFAYLKLAGAAAIVLKKQQRNDAIRQYFRE